MGETNYKKDIGPNEELAGNQLTGQEPGTNYQIGEQEAPISLCRDDSGGNDSNMPFMTEGEMAKMLLGAMYAESIYDQYKLDTDTNITRSPEQVLELLKAKVIGMIERGEYDEKSVPVFRELITLTNYLWYVKQKYENEPG